MQAEEQPDKTNKIFQNQKSKIKSVQAQLQPDGRMCLVKEEEVDSLEREQVFPFHF